MAVRPTAALRNILLTGHGGCGKTTLTERLLLDAGVLTRMGTVEDGNTASDWTEEEKHHKHSLQPSVLHFDHDGAHINLIDTPGMTDFLGHTIGCLPAVEMVAVVVDAAKGVESVTRRIMSISSDRNLPRMVIVNKIDDTKADLSEVMDALNEAFGSTCLPINLPAEGRASVIDVFEHHEGGATEFSGVDEAHTRIVEQVVEVDEDLMSEYLEVGDADALDKKKVHAAFERALREGHLVPVCFVSAKTGAGVGELMHVFSHLCPSPLEGNPRTFIMGGEEFHPDSTSADGHVVAHVFKVTSDPFVGKLGIFRVHQGTIKAKDELYVNEERKAVRLGHLLRLQGKDHTEVDAIGPGDLAAVSKIDEVAFDAVLHSSHDSDGMRLRALPLPKPMYGQAIELTNHADEAKFSGAVGKLQAEDPCFVVERIAATKQTVMRGLGELHLRVILEKLKAASGIVLETSQPKVAYKETIQSQAEGHH
ncbi:MAG: GTP-binding protein, partial [Phycisphaerales bacterium]|nr:GTP-binding protein [Phycisphaerales bacterium]